MSRIAFRNFTGGEVTPTLSARYDLQKFGTFLQCCENFIPNLHGDIERRPGTKFVDELEGPAVLLPFQFNTEAENNYVLIFMEGGILVADEGGVIPGVRLESPYALEDVYAISHHQAADVVYLAHKKYALRKLTRSGDAPDYQWELLEVALNQSLPAPGKPTVTFKGTANGTTLNYVITAVDEDGVESTASPVGSCNAKFPTEWVVGDNVTLSWQSVPGAKEYNIYRESAGYYGFIGVAGGTKFTDQNYEPDTAMTPKEDWNPFADGNHPSAVTVHQQRLVLAGTRDNPASFYMSRTGDYENFRKSRPLQDDDPVEYMLASGSIDDIRWLASFGELLIGTSGAEYKATSSGAAITPSDVQISTESYWGSAGLQPMIIGNSVMHCQRSGSHVRDLSYSWEKDGYAGNDLSLLAPELVETHSIRQWAFQQSPGSNIWCVREDGVLLCLTYMQEQKVYAWSRHTTQGKVLSCAAMCGESEDVIMLVTERGGRYFLERMARRFRDTDAIEDAFFVDCGRTVRREEADTEVTGLEHLEGREVAVLADGSPEEGHVVRDGKIELYYPARVVTVGLNFASVLAPMPVETDGDGGSTLGKRRAYGRVTLRLYRSVGGSYAATESGDLFSLARDTAWKEKTFYDLPFLPERYGEACQPFSGDLAVSLPSGQDADTSIVLKQDRPMPFRLVAVMADIDFGEQ
ncbi:hypothetical protein [uncultured Mailhella sp.]|uniref:phage nozzle protein n=1 Tax=uncultured Mailhella sp. TaxID=1981031 RepID=UPI00260C8DAC|nr:hypothetical protein [uncultured Mailhella sp.]